MRLSVLSVSVVSLSVLAISQAEAEKKDCRAVLRRVWANEYSRDREAERQLRQRLAAVRCKLALDIDGDGKMDAAVITHGKNLMIGIDVIPVNGSRTMLGGGNASEFIPAPERGPAERHDDFEFLYAWRRARLVK